MSALRPDDDPLEDGHHFNNNNNSYNNPTAGNGFRESLDVNDWTQRWKVVTSTKTRIVHNIILHGVLVTLLFTFAISIGVSGKQSHNGERLCVLRHDPRSNFSQGQSSACARPIATATIAMLISLAMCAYNVRSLKLYKPRDRRVVLAQVGLAAWMAIMTVWAAAWTARAKQATCDAFPPGSDCVELYDHYFGLSLRGLTFGIVMGFFAGIGWLVSTYQEFQSYRSSDGI
ncbi:hypothetical protein HDU86_003106 [Geranomyces michiganensis]|nr:hypothetical protein HDU86_003106 [Geranomyces michiganensis]